MGREERLFITKDLEPGKWVKIERWGDADEARRIVSEAIERAAANKN